MTNNSKTSNIADKKEAAQLSSKDMPPLNCCKRLWDYQDTPEAKGYALLSMGRGVAVMANVVFNAALLELAQTAAGCLTGEEKEAAGEDYECTNKIYGQNPLALISNIAVVTGLLSAFFMPFIGVILDFTSYRRFIGIVFAAVFTLIQIIQISIGPRTWFPMVILQSVGGFCFAGMIMTSLAYLPEICELVGQEKHSKYTARFTAKQFTIQALFLMLVGGLSFAFGIAKNSTYTARMAMGLNSFFIAILFGVGWHKYMPSRPASRPLPEGLRSCTSVVVYGLKQNIATTKSIYHQYKKGLFWFLLAEVFAQSSVGALTTLAVVYLNDVVGLNTADVSLFFLVVLIGTIPGARLAPIVTKRSNPNVAWQISMVSLFITIVVGAFTLGNAPNKYFSFVWGFFVGFNLGWFYPTENLFFSCALPKGSEAEIAGFRVISSMILSWLPPLLFSLMISNGIDPKWGMMAMAVFLIFAAFLLAVGTGKWEDILLESGRSEAQDVEIDDAEILLESGRSETQDVEIPNVQ
ncbi:autophagy-related protein 22 [Skeletonema marinoi]|uniref:Autophagy-related protein 22 n=1 Tax=Skeletonema marinoi TaxID=267567 RepID=A0AAD8XTU5_9STRA|nr:autophagy-related protein 22 [Skeletonema marinoi]